jgi:putative acetyltransferase
VLIRAVRKKDIPAIARLYYDTVQEVNARDYTPAQIQAWAPVVHADSFWASRFRGRHVFVAEAKGVIIGFAEFENTGHIDCFYVHHQWQGCGVGSRLIRRIAIEARRHGAPSLFADVSVTARPFFQNQGFKVIKRQSKRYRGCRFRQFFMRKTLVRPPYESASP